jgi:hypothetical protein
MKRPLGSVGCAQAAGYALGALVILMGCSMRSVMMIALKFKNGDCAGWSKHLSQP